MCHAREKQVKQKKVTALFERSSLFMDRPVQRKYATKVAHGLYGE